MVRTFFKYALVTVTLNSLRDTEEFTIITANRRNSNFEVVHFICFVKPYLYVRINYLNI